MATMRFLFFFLLGGSLLAFVVSGCSSTRHYGREVTPPDLSFAPLDAENDVKDLFGDNEEYRIGTGDELKIDVYNIPELSSKAMSISQFYGQVVDENGEILYPIIKSIKVGGLTKKEAAHAIEERLKDFVKNPDVTVEIVKFQSQFYYITGASTNNGKYSITPTTTIMEALSRITPISTSGSMTIVNTVYLKRKDKIIPLSLAEASKGKLDYTQVRLRDGDTFFVPPASAERVYIVGEVPRPGAYQITKPDYTVMDLVAEAGGIDPVTADTAALYLVRQYSGRFQFATLDYHKIIGGVSGHNVRLQPGDRLVVAPTGLTSYNRIIEQLLPTFQLLQAATGTLNNTLNAVDKLK